MSCLGFAGVGATFAGFSGVVAVFGQRAHGEWLPEDLFRLRNLMFARPASHIAAMQFAFLVIRPLSPAVSGANRTDSQ